MIKQNLKWQATYFYDGRITIDAISKYGGIWTIELHQGSWITYLSGKIGEKFFSTPLEAVKYCEQQENYL